MVSIDRYAACSHLLLGVQRVYLQVHTIRQVSQRRLFLSSEATYISSEAWTKTGVFCEVTASELKRDVPNTPFSKSDDGNLMVLVFASTVHLHSNNVEFEERVWN